MSAVDNARFAWDMAEGRVPWCGYDALVVTARSQAHLERQVARIRARLPVRVVGVVEPPSLRPGNLGGTVRAWGRALAAHPELEALPRVALLHDAGRASRTAALTPAEDGARGSLVVGGLVGGAPLRLIEAVAVTVMPFAASNQGHLDVFWGSQVVVPDTPWQALSPTPFLLAKWARDAQAPVSAGDASDLGLIDADDADRIRALVAQGTFSAAQACSWLAERPRAAWDVGSFRIDRRLLAALDGLRGVRDLDPDLTRPLALALRGVGDTPDAVARSLGPDGDTLRAVGSFREVCRLVRDHGALAPRDRWLGVARLGPAPLWQRFRHPSDWQRVAVDRDPALCAALRRSPRVMRSWIGPRWVESADEAPGVRDAVVHGCTLLAGSEVAGSTLVGVTGRVRADRSAIVGSDGDLVVSDAVVYGTRGAHEVHGGCLVGSADAAASGAGSPSGGRLPSPREIRALARAARDDRDATRALLSPVIALCDRLDPDARSVAAAALDVAWEALGIGEPGRFERVRRGVGVPGAPRDVAVLSRVTVGADVAVTSVVLERLRARFPDTRLHFVGPEGNAALLGDVVVHPVAYPRSGTLNERLEAWRAARRALSDLAPDLVVAPDSRIDQLGTLPLPGPYLFVEATLDGPPAPLSHVVNARLDAALGPGPHATPVVTAPRVPGRFDVAVQLGVGGNGTKALGLDFERALLRALVDTGARVLLDRGHGPQELARARELLDGLPHAAVTDRAGGIGDATAPDDARLVVFHGTLSGWAGRVATADRAIAYDSAGGHLAAARKRIDGALHPGTETTSVFAGHPHPAFAVAWRPSGAPVRVVDATDRPWRDVLAEVLG